MLIGFFSYFNTITTWVTKSEIYSGMSGSDICFNEVINLGIFASAESEHLKINKSQV